MALLALVSLFALTFFVIQNVRKELSEQIGENFRTQADSLDDLVTLYLVENVKELQALSASQTIRDSVHERNTSYAGTSQDILASIREIDAHWLDAADDDPVVLEVIDSDRDANAAARRLGEFLRIFPSHSELFVTDRYGATIGATGRLSDYYQADEEWWAAGWNRGRGGVFISEPEYDESANVTAILIAVPVHDEAGEVIGVLRSTLNVEDLFGLLANVQLGDTGRATLVAGSGDILFDSRTNLAPLPRPVMARIERRAGSYQTEGDRIYATGRTLGRSSVVSLTSGSGQQALGAVDRLGWATVISQSTDEAYASVDVIIRTSMVAAVIAVAASTVAVFLLASAITKRLTLLRNAAAEIGEGRLVPLPGGADEVGQLSNSLLQMAHRVDKRTEEMRRLASILGATPDIVATADLEGRLLYLNQTGRALLGITDDAQVQSRHWQDFYPPWAAELMTRVVLPSAQQSGLWTGETAVRDIAGIDIPVSQVILLHKGDGESPHFFSLIARDIRERKQFESQLVHLATHDPLTDLPNRRVFVEELEKEIARSKRFASRAGLLFIDLDNFKGINDTLGHRVGDDLLVGIARQLRRELRETDIVGRVGGDEFAVLLPQIDETDLPWLMHRLLDAIRSFRVVAAENPVGVTASIGVAVVPSDADTAEDALAHADLAMYRAKLGRDTFCFYSSTQDTDELFASQRLWEDRIRDALRTDGFVLFAQPVVGLQNGGEAFELLLRLKQGDELILPQEFLGIAERSGLIKEIDRWVVARAIDILGEEQRAGRNITLEVNLSGKAVGDDELLDTIREELSAVGVNPAGLVLEITETAAIANIQQADRFIRALKEMGCRFALDDFGVGFSSFYYLKHLPVDILKIDGSFVSNLARDQVDQHLVRAIVEVARGLGKSTVAEHVADGRTVELLRQMGVDYGQGFHLGLPAPLDEALAASRPAAA